MLLVSCIKFCGSEFRDSLRTSALQRSTPPVDKDDDNTGDEEFCGRRPTHLEQSASCPSNRNALASDVRPTSQEPPVWLTDSASEDYLGRTLQICASSSSSSSSSNTARGGCWLVTQWTRNLSDNFLGSGTQSRRIPAHFIHQWDILLLLLLHAEMSAWQGSAVPRRLLHTVTDVVGRQRLRSATQQMMVVPQHRLSTVGRRTFTVQGPWYGTPCRTTSAHSRTVSPIDSAWEPGFSLATSVLSALET